MNITVRNVKAEKTVNLAYPINNLDSSQEIAIVSVFSDNITYEITKPLELKLKIGDKGKAKKIIPPKTYTWRELNAFLSGNVNLEPLDSYPTVKKRNTLANITELRFILKELDNSQNLIDGYPSDILLTIHVTDYGNTTHYEPRNPQYKKLRNCNLSALTLEIRDQNNNLITDSLGTTVDLHIR